MDVSVLPRYIITNFTRDGLKVESILFLLLSQNEHTKSTINLTIIYIQWSYDTEVIYDC